MQDRTNTAYIFGPTTWWLGRMKPLGGRAPVMSALGAAWSPDKSKPSATRKATVGHQAYFLCATVWAGNFLAKYTTAGFRTGEAAQSVPQMIQSIPNGIH
jgi:hypothetical protein